MAIKHKLRGKLLIILGLMLVIAAGILYYNNLSEDKNADKASMEILENIECGMTENVCGELVIKKVNLHLPILSEWSEYGLTQAPCRYLGNAETFDMIIAGHNYKSHFASLKNLSCGDIIEFNDITGNKYIYTVKEISTLDGTAVSDMKSGDWDLTLFTCTPSGKQRVTVRCEIK